MKDNVSNSQQNTQKQDDWNNSKSSSWNKMIIEKEETQLINRVSQVNQKQH